MESFSLLSQQEQKLPLMMHGNGNGNDNQQPFEPSRSNNTAGSIYDNDAISKCSTIATDADDDFDINDNDEDLPNNVCTEKQLSSLPIVCLNQDAKTKKERPLRHVDEHGKVYTYALTPMFYSVIFILIVEALERFSFYGVSYTMTSFLTGAYDDRKKNLPDSERWDADMSAVSASSMVSISTAIAYSTPFAGAILADCFLGEYKAILIGSIVFYLPGLLLILASTIPHLWGFENFNRTLLSIGMLGLWPIGTGILKSIVNIFGAKQFHPLLQSSKIESYYVKFYMCINIGSLIGGIVVPFVAQRNMIYAYTFPVTMLLIGILMFLSGTPRYVCHPPSGDLLKGIQWFPNRKKKNNASSSSSSPLSNKSSDTFASSSLVTIFKISALTIPFNIAYSQMATTFIVQGTVMKRAFGWIDAASMNNADAIAVLTFGHLVGSYLYPYLNRHNIKLTTTNKFALGSALGAAAIAWALFVEHKIHNQYAFDGKKVSVLWQALSYTLIGAGEIFAVSAAYEVAFTASPPDQKVLASALNLFCVGGIPNLICIVLYNVCKSWFAPTNGRTAKNNNDASISNLEDYVSAQIYKYFLVLLGVALLGVIINILPFIQNYVQTAEEASTESIKTPNLRTPLARRRKERKGSNKRNCNNDENSMSTAEDTDEEASSLEASPLLQMQRHKAYLKYGSGPELYKSGSMRAGPSFSSKKYSDKLSCEGDNKNTDEKNRKKSLNKHQVGRLYRNISSKIGNSKSTSSKQQTGLVVTSEGKPLQAGNIMKTKR
mmetsp:Transcript_46370/g.52698  ORF Transcript_46370/g.52698 Transcript_46370/m.52698 type:complete len:775 (-) Transcript_46370:223-2547(-)